MECTTPRKVCTQPEKCAQVCTVCTVCSGQPADVSHGAQPREQAWPRDSEPSDRLSSQAAGTRTSGVKILVRQVGHEEILGRRVSQLVGALQAAKKRGQVVADAERTLRPEKSTRDQRAGQGNPGCPETTTRQARAMRRDQPVGGKQPGRGAREGQRRGRLRAQETRTRTRREHRSGPGSGSSYGRAKSR